MKTKKMASMYERYFTMEGKVKASIMAHIIGYSTGGNRNRWTDKMGNYSIIRPEDLENEDIDDDKRFFGFFGEVIVITYENFMAGIVKSLGGEEIGGNSDE